MEIPAFTGDDRMSRRSFILALIPLSAIAIPPVSADLIKLKNGGELRGDIAGEEAVNGAFTLTTLSGATISIAESDIEFVTRRPLKKEQYEAKARRVANTVAARWELAEWCRQRNLDTERDEQLELILDLDPEHRKAHYGLGHTKSGGKWRTREEKMIAQGYVKYKGRYISEEELELLEKSKEQREAEQAWFQKVRMWKNWLTGRYPKQQTEAYENLIAISNVDAVPALLKNFSDEGDIRLRQLYVKILAGMRGDKPVPAIVRQAIFDSDRELRYTALNALSKDQYVEAMPLFVKQLRHDSNEIVRRTGIGLQRVGDDRVVGPLIDSLITTHRYNVPVDAHNTMSFGSDGSFGSGGGVQLTPELAALLSSGQYNGAIINVPNQMQKPKKMKILKLNQQNPESLRALQKITGENYGYDERTWKLWLGAKKSGALKKPAE